jgi:RimJ/RimL family protein N-acetyltransferase
VTGTDRILGKTDRLVLRHPEESELEMIGDLWTDPRATAYIGGPRDRSQVLGFFREYIANPETWGHDEGERWWSIVERHSGDFVGLCALLEKEIEDRAETEPSYFLLPAYWGRGYATEASRLVAAHAFADLGLHSLVAVIDPCNEPSARVVRKGGMVLEREVLRSDAVVRQVYRLARSGPEQAGG